MDRAWISRYRHRVEREEISRSPHVLEFVRRLRERVRFRANLANVPFHDNGMFRDMFLQGRTRSLFMRFAFTPHLERWQQVLAELHRRITRMSLFRPTTTVRQSRWYELLRHRDSILRDLIMDERSSRFSDDLGWRQQVLANNLERMRHARLQASRTAEQLTFRDLRTPETVRSEGRLLSGVIETQAYVPPRIEVTPVIADNFAQTLARLISQPVLPYDELIAQRLPLNRPRTQPMRGPRRDATV
jgi:hypothetical protein